jgi:excisionase family DNA binding protein
MKTKLTDYVLTAEAAETLGVSQNTLRAWAKAGKIPMYLNPDIDYRLFRRADLKKFLLMPAEPMQPLWRLAR